jgi:hypothetical protein
VELGHVKEPHHFLAEPEPKHDSAPVPTLVFNKLDAIKTYTQYARLNKVAQPFQL